MSAYVSYDPDISIVPTTSDDKVMAPLSVCCMATQVKQEYVKQLKASIDTWGTKAEQLNIPLYFICGPNRSSLSNEPRYGKHIVHIDSIGDDYQSATDKQWLGLKFLYENKPAKWYAIFGTDNYIFVDKLVNILGKLGDGTKPMLVGGHRGHESLPDGAITYFSGCGLMLSHAALTILYPKLTQYKDKWIKFLTPNYNRLNPACDVALYYYCLKNDIDCIYIDGVHGCNWQGKDFQDNVCCNIDYDKAIILHRCNDPIDHWNAHRYNGEQYKTLNEITIRYKPHLLQAKLYSILYNIGNNCDEIYDYSNGLTPVSVIMMKGLIDTYDKIYRYIYATYKDERVELWKTMASLNECTHKGQCKVLIKEILDDITTEIPYEFYKYVVIQSNKPLPIDYKPLLTIGGMPIQEQILAINNHPNIRIFLVVLPQ